MRPDCLARILPSGFMASILIAPSTFATQNRLALIMGNGDYKSGCIKNPTNDAIESSLIAVHGLLRCARKNDVCPLLKSIRWGVG